MTLNKNNIHPDFIKLFKDTFGFNEAEFDMLLLHIHIQKLKKKEFYLRAGDICRQRAYLNKGCTRNFILDENGNERIMFFAFEDWWLGDIDSYYSGEPGVNFIQALEDCELLIITKDAFVKLDKLIPKLQQWYPIKMQRRANALTKQINEIKTTSSEQRYIQLLQKHPQIFQRVPLQYIASYLNIEPQSLSRIRKRLIKKID